MKMINCVSSPRNISTALMYAFAQRRDTRVVDEPFYAYYLLKTGKDHPGREQTLASQSVDLDVIFKGLNAQNDRDILFIKNMSKHMELIDERLFDATIPVFLIREPAALIASFAKGYPNPRMEDIGLTYQFRLFERSLDRKNNPIVLDTTEVLKNPRAVLGRLCHMLEIPFDQSMLAWPAGPRPEDGVWARYWYHSVHRSTGFKPPTEKTTELPANCEALYQKALPLYEKLYLHAIKA